MSGIAAQNLLEVRDLCKHFPIMSRGLRPKQVGLVKACHNINFDLKRGETIGLVGESGSGKTTTARTILRALTPTSGNAVLNVDGQGVDLASLSDKELKPLRTRMQMIFQDPFASLNPRMTVGEIIEEGLKIHKIGTADERQDRVSEMLVRVGLKGEFRTRHPHAFSGGQRQRIGIARALVMRPELVVADEAVSALDVSVQAQVLNLLKELQHEFGLTYLFVAHDLSVVRYLCDRVAVMYGGRIVELAETEAIFEDPKHPYTKALLGAVPHPDPDRRLERTVAGEAVDPAKLPSGCAFHPRCASCMDRCSSETPALAPVGEGRLASCFLHHNESERDED